MEVERQLDADEAEALWPHTAGRRLEKRRHRVPLGDVVAEVDVYGGALDGLLVVEVEFPSEAAAAAFVAPPWFGEEVTGRPAVEERRPGETLIVIAGSRCSLGGNM